MKDCETPIKEGTLVKFKSKEELLAIDYPHYGNGTVNHYANRIALIVNASKNGFHYDYEVYFPDDDDTRAWSHKDDFIVIKDLISEYRMKADETNE